MLSCSWKSHILKGYEHCKTSNNNRVQCLISLFQNNLIFSISFLKGIFAWKNALCPFLCFKTSCTALLLKLNFCDYLAVELIGALLPQYIYNLPLLPQIFVHLPFNVQYRMSEAALWLILMMLSTNHSGGAWG